MMQRNVHEMVDLVELAARLGVEQLNFCHMVSYEGLDMEQESPEHTKALSNYWLERALARPASSGLEVQFAPAPFALDGATTTDAPTAGRRGRHQPFLPTPYCPFPFFHISHGTGRPRAALSVLPRRGALRTGLRDTPIDQIWLGTKFTTLRPRILRHDPPEMCRRCSFLSNRYPDVAALFATRRSDAAA